MFIHVIASLDLTLCFAPSGLVRKKDTEIFETKLRVALGSLASLMQMKVQDGVLSIEDLVGFRHCTTKALQHWPENEELKAFEGWAQSLDKTKEQDSAFALLKDVLVDVLQRTGVLTTSDVERLLLALRRCGPFKAPKAIEDLTASLLCRVMEALDVSSEEFQAQIDLAEAISTLMESKCDVSDQLGMWKAARDLVASRSKWESLGATIDSRMQVDKDTESLTALIHDQMKMKKEHEEFCRAHRSSKADAPGHEEVEVPEIIKEIMESCAALMTEVTIASVGKQATLLIDEIKVIIDWAGGDKDGQSWSQHIVETTKLTAVIKTAKKTLLQHENYDQAAKRLDELLKKYLEAAKQIGAPPDADLIAKVFHLCRSLTLRHAEWLLVSLHGSSKDTDTKSKKARAIRKQVLQLPMPAGEVGYFNGWEQGILPQLMAYGEEAMSA